MLLRAQFLQVFVRAVFFIGLVFAAQLSSAAATVDVSAVRFGQNGDTTRFVIELSGQTKPAIFLLADPYRVVVDLPQVAWKGKGTVQSKGVVKGYRHGLFTEGTYRIVLDLKNPAKVASSFMLPANSKNGPRFVIDLKDTNRSGFLKAVAASKSQRTRFTAQSETPVALNSTRRTSGKRLVILDAGHGGVDPGTLGVLGVNEKVITLAIAKTVERELRRTGRYDVKMTRDRDIFIPVRRRGELGRKWGGDLFISIHADAIKNPKVRGGTVYTLSERASDKEAERLAARENKSDLIAGLDLVRTDDTVTSILIDLAQRETLNYSARFAQFLLPEMRREVRMHKKGHRFANLGMLKSPDMPSILLETGYLTNKEDARMLNSKQGQAKISKAVRRAVDRYFSTIVAEGR